MKNSARKNMSYAELYESLHDGVVNESTKTSLPLFYSIPPNGLDKDKNIRASIRSLKLTADHKSRSPTIHVFGSDILISMGYKSRLYPSTIFYCAWLESNPHILIFWERDINNGITSAIKDERYIKLESELHSSLNSLSISSSECSVGLSKKEFCGGTRIDGLRVDAAGHE